VDAELLAKVGPQRIEHTRVALAALAEMAGWNEIPAEDEA
jgi:hypothetical protein